MENENQEKFFEPLASPADQFYGKGNTTFICHRPGRLNARTACDCCYLLALVEGSRKGTDPRGYGAHDCYNHHVTGIKLRLGIHSPLRSRGLDLTGLNKTNFTGV